jgi:hypothetical protein
VIMQLKQLRFYIFLGISVTITLIVVLAVVPKMVILANANRANSASAASHSSGGQNLSSWSGNFSINTDWETSWPDTGVTRTVNMAPD